jgi:hypothetical protein
VRMGHLVDEHLRHQRRRRPRPVGGRRDWGFLGRASFPLDPFKRRR